MKAFYLLAIFSLTTLTNNKLVAQSKIDRTLKIKKAKKVIFMVGDGMGLTQIYAGLTASKNNLNLAKFKCIGFSKTNCLDGYITDSGAGATAFATGSKTKKYSISVDSAGNPLITIMEIAEKKGLSTGIVVTTDITDATPAAFASHQPKRDMYEEIALDYLNSGVDILLGANPIPFVKRKDNRNLIDEFKKINYYLIDSMYQFDKLPDSKILGFLSGQPYEHRPAQQLLKSSMASIDLLNKNKNGFILMIEGSQIDDAGHANDVKYLINEILDFDSVIGKVLAFAEKDGETLVIVTADHETGGLTLTGGDFKTGTIEAKFSTTGHTGVMVPVFAYGPGAELFMGIYENNEIFYKIKTAVGFK